MQCSRCEKESKTRTRGENFCADCYRAFVSKKFHSEMGHFRVNGFNSSEDLPKLIIFISFGASSLALVDLMVSMQEEQREKYSGMVGFHLECINLSTHPMPNWPWPHVPLKQLPPPRLPTNEEQRSMDRSTRHDMSGVLLRNAAVSIAANSNSIAVFGFSTTKLSELTLAETVKGRGATIPSIVSPDVRKDHIVYPLRDLTLPELKTYCQLNNLDSLVVPEPAVPGITKLQSIDEIVRNYFADVQKDFPSVVSTVSKVASRLSQEAEPCALCQLESIAPALSKNSQSTELCYACRSALNEPRLSQPLDILREFEL